MTDRAASVIEKSLRGKDSSSTDLSSVARALTDLHTQRPGLFGKDLELANEALHHKGLLPDLDIVAVKGQDLITRERTGEHKTRIVDAADTALRRDPSATTSPSAMGSRGREAQMNPDGSARYKVKGGDNEWSVAYDMLHGQTGEKPTPTEQANYLKELHKANPSADLKHLKPGQELTLPPVTKGGADTTMTGARDERDTAHKLELLKKDGAAAQSALEKQMKSGLTPSFSSFKEQLEKATTNPALTPDERNSLEMLQKDLVEAWKGAQARPGVSGVPKVADVIQAWDDLRQKRIETARHI